VRAGEPEAGLPLLARACAADRTNPLAHVHHGIGLLSAGRAGRAAARFRRATALAPAQPAGWINFASALLALRQPRAARAAARRALKLAPNDPAALRALGNGHAALGELDAAVSVLSDAIRAAPDAVDTWIDLGQVYARQGAMREAMECMRRALAIAPENGAAASNLAAFGLLRGEQEEALEALRGIVARNPNCLPARLNLANALLLDQDAAGGLEALAGTPPPGREGAHWRAYRALALILLGRNTEATAELDAIPEPYGDAEILIIGRRLHLADRAGDPGAGALAERLGALIAEDGAAILEHRVIACFDLARHFLRRGAQAEAFAQWTQGHALLKRVQPFSREVHRAFTDATIASYSAERLRDGARAANRDPAPVFILGLPRSGTTLCEQILSAHAEVHGGGERSAIHRLITSLAGQPLRADTVERLAGLDAGVLDEAATGFLADLHGLDGSARLFTDKMPANALHLGFIGTLLPGAKIILCTRDPRDIGLSIFQLRFFGYHPYAHDLGDLGWYIAEHERLMAHWRAVLPNPLIEVALSDWVHDFAGTLDRVLAFLDLPYDPACADFHQSNRRVRTASAAQVRQPINARGLGRWREYESYLAPMLAELSPL